MGFTAKNIFKSNFLFGCIQLKALHFCLYIVLNVFLAWQVSHSFKWFQKLSTDKTNFLKSIVPFQQVIAEEEKLGFVLTDMEESWTQQIRECSRSLVNKLSILVRCGGDIKLSNIKCSVY